MTTLRHYETTDPDISPIQRWGYNEMGTQVAGRPLETEADQIAAALERGQVRNARMFTIKHDAGCTEFCAGTCCDNTSSFWGHISDYWDETLHDFKVAWDPTIRL